MTMGQNARLGTVLLGWVPIGALLVAIARSNGWTWVEALGMTLPICLGGAALFTSVGYLARAFPLRSENATSRWTAWVTAALAMGGLWSGLALVLAYALNPLPGLGAMVQKTRLALPTLATFGVVLYFAVLGLHYLVIAQQRVQEAEAKQLELRCLTQDAELKALRAQINPHFLFNSLNSISALTTLNPQGARDMCIQLSDFLRRSLGLGERQSVSLREELDLVRTYLSIEKTRFAERLSLDWDIDPDALEVPIPPLLLQPLVENAIKHGISALPEGGTLRILVRVDGPAVRIEVENPRDSDADVPKGLGLGLRQVRERLKGRYGTTGGFDARSDDGTHRVTLRIPLENPA